MDKRIKSGGRVNLPPRDLTKEYDATDSKTKKKTSIKKFFKNIFLGKSKEKQYTTKEINRRIKKDLEAIYLQKAKDIASKKKPKHTIHSYDQWSHVACLNDAISILKNTSYSSRDKLNILFNEPHFEKNLFSLIPPISCQKNDVLLFLKLYRSAVENEIKPKQSKDPSKKDERLEAIDELIKQTRSLKPEADNRVMYGVILQCAGRIREGQKVTQTDKPYCGVYAAIKASWDSYPKNATRLTLHMAHVFLNGTSARKEHTFPKGFDVCKLFADELLVCYTAKKKIDAKQSGAFFSELTQVLDDMNVPYKEIQSHHQDLKQQAFDYVQAFETETKNGAGIWAVVNADFTKLLYDIFRKNMDSSSRKALFVPNMERVLEEKLEDLGKNVDPHALEIQRVRILNNDYFEIKMHTWGRSIEFELPMKYFYHVLTDVPYGFYSIGARGTQAEEEPFIL